MPTRFLTTLALMALVCCQCKFRDACRAADHLDSPRVMNSNGTLDINDLYAFQSPTNANNVVLVMTVNPLAGVRSGTTFETRGVYEFTVDATGDAVPDQTYRIYFAAARRGVQRFVVVASSGAAIASGQTGSVSSVSGGGSVTAGLFDDPFFFDLAGFNNGLAFTGVDFFRGLNINAIVLELPRSALGSDNVAITARTIVNGQQFDRMGRPGITTVLIPTGRKDLFNSGSPATDVANFTGDVVARIMSLGRTAADAAGLAAVLLPDQLTINTGSSAGFLNGRRLADDVIDIELQVLTGNAAATDGVASNDKAFFQTFPYLAAPH